MVPVGLRNYFFETAGERVLEYLKRNKGTPQSIKEISQSLRIDETTVKLAIHSIQRKTDLCQEEDKYYFPVNKMRWYLAAFGVVIMCTYTFCSLIKYYHI